MIHRGNTPWRPLETAAVSWDGTTLRSTEYGDIYFSVDDGLAESEYVFIEGNNLAQRFAALEPGSRFTIGELGFGTGLNFCLVCEVWLRHAPPSARLHYVGIDAHPLHRSRLSEIGDRFNRLNGTFTPLIDLWPHPVAGCHRRLFHDDAVTLDLWWESAEDALADLGSHGRRWVDAWFLDGFAPAKNKSMWSEQLWHHISALSRPKATVATFTAAGSVRRGLATAGFQMSKRPGYGRKRESLIGVLEKLIAVEPPCTPWDLAPPINTPKVTVIGAGLAGAHLARALAVRGVEVLVLEASDIAGGGSSNRQGVTYTRLSRRYGDLSDFALASYQYALPRHRQLFAQHQLVTGHDGDFCGYLQLTDDEETLSALSLALKQCDGLAAVLDAAAASRIAGITLDQAALWYPEAGWLYPRKLIAALLEHPNITLRTSVGTVELANRASSDLMISGEPFHSPVTVVACAHKSLNFPPLSWLPLQAIRGQTTSINSVPPLSSLQTVICRKGYLPPAVDQRHCIGASFGPNDEALDEREADHAHNLRELKAALPSYDLAPTVTGSNVALRCNSSDYLPVAGAVTNGATFAATYPELRSRSRKVIDATAPVHEGLWCLAGLGSRGLTAAPVLAELLSAQMLDEPPPLPRYLQRAVSPARFLERRLKRGEL